MTAYRSQTDAMLAARFDPMPWRHKHPGCGYDGNRATERADLGMVFDPRPEFIPWYSHPDNVWFETRPEPNPILVEFREARPGLSVPDRARDFLLYMTQNRTLVAASYNPDQIDHARKVLKRLAHL